MLKRFSLALTIVFILMIALQTAVMAAVLEVDTSSAQFKSDTWQNNVDGNEICPLSNCFATTPTRTAANGGTDNADIKRFTASLQAGAANVEGELTFANGMAMNNIVFPFKETVQVESITLKFNNGGRQYFFSVYTSMDGLNWTEVDISEKAQKVTVLSTYDDGGSILGPSVVCYASTPAGLADNDDVIPITFKLAQSPETKYLKMTFYGNDAESGDFEVANPWVSFNTLKFEGSVVQAAAAPVEIEPEAPADQPVADTAPAPVTNAPAAASQSSAPQTGDTNIALIIAICVSFAGTAIVIFKKKRSF